MYSLKVTSIFRVQKPTWEQVESRVSIKVFPILSKLSGKITFNCVTASVTVVRTKGSHACWLRLCNTTYDWLFSNRRFPRAYKWTIHVHYMAFILVWEDMKPREHKRWSITKNRQSVKQFRYWITWTEEIFYVILSEGHWTLHTYVTTNKKFIWST